MQDQNWELVLHHSSELGEGPVWDPERQRLLWVDILSGHIHQFYPSSQKHTIFDVGQMVGAVALTTSGQLIAALQNGFHLIELDAELISPIGDPEEHLPENRFNDGKCDPAGRFWAGTMSVHDTPGAGKLYMLDSDVSITEKISNIGCSNGLAWSNDHSAFYYIDTAAQAVVKYDYEITTAAIHNPQTIIAIPTEEGYPDGMTIDTEGMLWIALWDGWKVVRYNPHTGKKIWEYHLPVSRPTSVCFGGELLQDLYVTSAKTGLSPEQLDKQPHAGSVFIFKATGCQGSPPDKFVYKDAQ